MKPQTLKPALINVARDAASADRSEAPEPCPPASIPSSVPAGGSFRIRARSNPPELPCTNPTRSSPSAIARSGSERRRTSLQRSITAAQGYRSLSNVKLHSWDRNPLFGTEISNRQAAMRATPRVYSIPSTSGGQITREQPETSLDILSVRRDCILTVGAGSQFCQSTWSGEFGRRQRYFIAGPARARFYAES